jgi:hypothetical protein
MKKYILLCFTFLSLHTFSQLPSYVPTTGLICWYPFTGNANDSSGNGNNGIVSGATLTTDRFGNANSAYSFNGTSNYITATLNTPLNTQNISGLTLSGWCFLNSLPTTTPSPIVSIWDAATSDVYGTTYEDSHLEFFGDNGVNGSAATMQLYGSPTPSINTWYHVLMTCNYSDNVSKLYINGVFQDSSSSVLNRPIIASINIGSWWENGWFANGKLDDIGFWSVALTQQEITNLYNGSVSIPCSTTDTLIINTPLTGINPPNNTNTIEVYPNPASDHILINTGDYSTMNGYTIKIINVLSQVVFQNLVNQQLFNISLSGWSHGTYLLEILDGSNAVIETKTIILQ